MDWSPVHATPFNDVDATPFNDVVDYAVSDDESHVAVVHWALRPSLVLRLAVSRYDANTFTLSAHWVCALDGFFLSLDSKGSAVCFGDGAHPSDLPAHGVVVDDGVPMPEFLEFLQAGLDTQVNPLVSALVIDDAVRVLYDLSTGILDNQAAGRSTHDATRASLTSVRRRIDVVSSLLGPNDG